MDPLGFGHTYAPLREIHRAYLRETAEKEAPIEAPEVARAKRASWLRNLVAWATSPFSPAQPSQPRRRHA